MKIKLNYKKIILFIIGLLILNEMIYNIITDKRYFIKENIYRIELINQAEYNINSFKENTGNYPEDITKSILLNNLNSSNIYTLKFKNNLILWEKLGVYRLSSDKRNYILGIKIFPNYIDREISSGIVSGDYFYKTNSLDYLNSTSPYVK